MALGRLVCAMVFAGPASVLPVSSAASDRPVLVALYEAAGGDNWAERANWLSAEPLASWYGVSTDGDGRVTALFLSDNRLTGEISPALGDLTLLREMDLARNALRGEIPTALKNLRSLISMRLSGNRLTGEIPLELGSLANLMDLDLAHNALTGGIPSTLGDLPNLARLDLSHNALTGEITDDLTSLGNLIVLDLSGNSLAGRIPVDMAHMTDLWSLKLNSTLLSGPIPAGLARLPKLEFLELAFNHRLSGAVPSALRELALDTLDLTGTPVCVAADAGFQGWLRTVERFRSSGLTCGEPVPAESIVDVAVVYTPAAAKGAGGTVQLEAIIDLMVAEANQAYEASGVDLEIALVVRTEVSYAEVDTETDLQRLRGRADGYLDEVHGIRDRAGADLVHLIVGTDDYDAAGIADTVGAFGISHYRGGGITFAHELGHNMGLNHDRYAGCRTNCEHQPYRFAYGYVNRRGLEPDAPSSARWFTIMAYHDECTAAGVVCTELPRFSSPNQIHDGDPLGVPGEGVSFDVGGPADAVRVLNTMRHSVASLRDRVSGSPRKRSISARASCHSVASLGDRVSGTPQRPTSATFASGDAAPTESISTRIGHDDPVDGWGRCSRN